MPSPGRGWLVGCAVLVLVLVGAGALLIGFALFADGTWQTLPDVKP